LSISAYFLSLNKIIDLDNLGTDRPLDIMILPDDHAIVLTPIKIKTFDLQGLLKSYPGNVDFYTNTFKTISLESTTKFLVPSIKPYFSLKLSGNSILLYAQDGSQLTEFPLTSLYPRSSCPCWDSTNNTCLLQSACLGQTP